jgi:hypothetical protein
MLGFVVDFAVILFSFFISDASAQMKSTQCLLFVISMMCIMHTTLSLKKRAEHRRPPLLEVDLSLQSEL